MSLTCLTPWWKTGQSALIRDLVEREPRPRPEAVARQVEPARLVPRASSAAGRPASRSGSQRARRAEGGHWSRGTSSISSSRLISRDGPVFLGRRDRPERGPDRGDRRVDLRLLDDDAVGLRRPRPAPRGRGRAARGRGAGSGAASGGRRCELWHQSSTVPTSVTRAASRTGDALGLRLAADPHQALQRRQVADRVGVGRDEVAGPVVGADRASSPAGRRRAGPSTGRNRGGRSSDLVPFLRVARDDAEPGSVGPRPTRTRRRYDRAVPPPIRMPPPRRTTP